LLARVLLGTSLFAVVVSLGPVASVPAAARNRCLRDGYGAYGAYGGPVQIVAGRDGRWLYACWAPSGRRTQLGLAPKPWYNDTPVVIQPAVGGRYLVYTIRVAWRDHPPDALWKLDVRSGRRHNLWAAVRCPSGVPDPTGITNELASSVVSPVIDAHGSLAWACITVDGLIQRMDARGVAVLDSWSIDQVHGPFGLPVIRLRGTKLSWRIPGRPWRSARLVDRR